MSNTGTGCSLFPSWLASKGSTLLQGLVSYWKLDEISGPRNDSKGSNHLTDNNTVGSRIAGPIGTVASAVVDSSEYLNTGAATIDTSGDFTVAMWVKHNGNNTDNKWVDIWGHSTHTATSYPGIFMETQYSGWHRLYQREGAAVSIEIGYNTGWVLVVYKYVNSTSTGNVKALGSTVNHDVWSADDVFDLAATDDFTVCKNNGASGLTFQIGPTGIWTSALSDANITALFNGGTALKYADLGSIPAPAHYWNMDESSGNRADSVTGAGNAPLLDNATVGSATAAGDAMRNNAASFVAGNLERLSNASNVLSGATEFTLNFWAKDHAAGRPFAIENETVSRFFFGTTVVAGAVNWYIFDTDVAYVTAQGTFPTTSWGMVTVTYTAADKKLRVYLDNVLQATSSALGGTPNFASSAPTNLGAYLYAGVGDQFYTGLLDEAAIWSRVLDVAERTELYNSGAGKFYPFA